MRGRKIRILINLTFETQLLIFSSYSINERTRTGSINCLPLQSFSIGWPNSLKSFFRLPSIGMQLLDAWFCGEDAQDCEETDEDEDDEDDEKSREIPPSVAVSPAMAEHALVLDASSAHFKSEDFALLRRNGQLMALFRVFLLLGVVSAESCSRLPVDLLAYQRLFLFLLSVARLDGWCCRSSFVWYSDMLRSPRRLTDASSTASGSIRSSGRGLCSNERFGEMLYPFSLCRSTSDRCFRGGRVTQKYGLVEKKPKETRNRNLESRGSAWNLQFGIC